MGKGNRTLLLPPFTALKLPRSGKEQSLQCAGLIFEAICNEYFGLGLFRSVVDLKSKISDRNNMAFHFCLRDFLSAIFMYHSVVTNSYSSSKPILQQES